MSGKARAACAFVTAAVIHLMAGFKIILLAFVFILASSAASNECPANQETSCDSLRAPHHGYTYTVPADIPCSEDCEHGWYYQNGTFIVDSTPNADGKRLPVVVDVTPQKLSLSVCENLKWELICAKCNCSINYQVTRSIKHPGARDTLTKNNTSVDEQDGNRKGNDFPDWAIALLAIAGGSIVILFIGIGAKRFCNKTQNAVI